MLIRCTRCLLPLLLMLLLLLSACTDASNPTASGEISSNQGKTEAVVDRSDDGVIQMPDIVEGKFNIAFVYVGPVGDGGWTYAHNEGRLYLEETLGDQIHTTYLENIPEGADSERVIRNLARKGFDVIFGTAFGYMDAMAIMAEEFPDIYFVHIAGFQKNETNFANIFGAMESTKYLVGMMAGARAAADGNYRVGYIAPFPIPEIVRHINATALGMRRTCPECELDIRWIFAWFDPDLESEATLSMIEAGAGVIISGADTPVPVQVAGEQGQYGVGYNSHNGCDVDLEHCLTSHYWNWGPEYARLVQEMMADSFIPEDVYFDVDSGSLGLLGFMEGEEPLPTVSQDVATQVKALFDKMQAGEMSRFDIFTGPINDNKGNVVVPDGVVLTQSDLDGIDAELGAQLGRDGCTICMNWLAEGVVADAEIP